MLELAQAGIGRDRVEWDRTSALCIAIMSPWIGLAGAFGIDLPEVTMEEVNPYAKANTESEAEKTPEEIAEEEAVAKEKWKSFSRALREKADGRRV